MAVQPLLVGVEGTNYSDELFGGNILATRGELSGQGQYADAIEDLRITTLRWPGGSLTEKSFDINHPDAETVVDANTGEVDTWIGLTEFFTFAEANNHAVSIVVPTRFNLSEQTDSRGNRYPEFSEEDLRTFVRDVASGEYGSPTIHAFEIGNEYWHSGLMNSVEYGRLASEMADIIDSELHIVSKTVPEACEIQVTVQMGNNFGTARIGQEYQDLTAEETLAALSEDYGFAFTDDVLYNDGTVNFGHVNNLLIMNEFIEDGTMGSVDGVIAHIYSLGEDIQYSRIADLELLNETWISQFPDLEIHVTEWNQRGVTGRLERDEDYGLHQAEEMLNLMEEFSRLGVDHAHVWPLINFTDNALNNGWTYDETNAPGAMFRLMSENLPGKALLDLNPTSERVTEAEFENINVHGFAGEGELLLYVTGTQHEGITQTNLDLSGLVLDFEKMELTILGVEPDSEIGSNRSEAVLEEVSPENALSGSILNVTLDPGEILQVVITGVIPTDALAPVIDSSHSTDDFDVEEDTELDFELVADPSSSEDVSHVHEDDYVNPNIGIMPDEWDIPTVVISDEIKEEQEEDELSDLDDAGLSILLAAMPILGLLAFMG